MNYYEANEKRIRLHRACDALLFLMVKNLLSTLDLSVFNSSSINRFKLSDVSPDTEKGMLSVPIDVKLPVHGKLIVQHNLKLKNYGDFRRLIKDRRLEGLMPYLPQTTIERSTIENELEAFDRVRIQFHALVLNFESAMAKKYSVPFDSNSQTYVSFTSILDAIPSQDLHDHQKTLLRLIRNAFSHNQYPDYEKLKNEIEGVSSDLTIAERLLQIASSTFSV